MEMDGWRLTAKGCVAKVLAALRQRHKRAAGGRRRAGQRLRRAVLQARPAGAAAVLRRAHAQRHQRAGAAPGTRARRRRKRVIVPEKTACLVNFFTHESGRKPLQHAALAGTCMRLFAQRLGARIERATPRFSVARRMQQAHMPCGALQEGLQEEVEGCPRLARHGCMQVPSMLWDRLLPTTLLTQACRRALSGSCPRPKLEPRVSCSAPSLPLTCCQAAPVRTWCHTPVCVCTKGGLIT